MKSQDLQISLLSSNIMKERIKTFIYQPLDEEDVLQNNEIQANKLAGFVMFLASIVLAIVCILSMAGVFYVKKEIYRVLLFRGIPELLIPALLCRITKARKAWLKYVLLIEFMIVLARIDSIMGFNAVLIMVIPVVLSCRFYSKHFTVLISVLTVILYGLSSFANAYWNIGYLDLNFYDPPKGTSLLITGTLREAVLKYPIDRMIRLQQVMTLSYLPKVLVFILIAVVCVKIASRGRQMVLEQEEITKKSSRIESELTLANDIQAHMLPTIFPPYPDCEEVRLYASMTPAKEVGGDFYDFFMLDDRNIAFIVADVSGKGVPAALFMVIAKTLIKNETNMGSELADIFTKINHMLCEGNDNNMFVTAWMGILNTETGVLRYVNAGHNPPLIKTGDQEFKYLKSKPGFVLAGMDGIRYKQYELQMCPGDSIFLYTDGVTEATNAKKEMFGEYRLQNYLNQHTSEDVKQILQGLKAEIFQFTGEEEQFDDITMLILNYQKEKPGEYMLEKKFQAKENQLTEVLQFVEKEMEEHELPMKLAMQISVCVEEIFTNIARYAYAKAEEDVTLGIRYEENELTMRFVDHGIPFDPLLKKDPDISLSADEREIGGLGIFIVKKTMDDVNYEYKNGKNILTIKKKI